MAFVIVLAYVIGWALTSVVLTVSSRWLKSRRRPPPHPLVVSFLAGALWPLLLLGVVEYGAAAAASKVVSDDEPGIAVIA